MNAPVKNRSTVPPASGEHDAVKAYRNTRAVIRKETLPLLQQLNERIRRIAEWAGVSDDNTSGANGRDGLGGQRADGDGGAYQPSALSALSTHSALDAAIDSSSTPRLP